MKGSDYFLFLFLERLMYEVCLVRIKEQVGVKRNIVGTNKQGLQKKLCKANKSTLWSRGQAETSLKIEDLRSNKTTGKLS